MSVGHVEKRSPTTDFLTRNESETVDETHFRYADAEIDVIPGFGWQSWKITYGDRK
jgi:hypothetical protein